MKNKANKAVSKAMREKAKRHLLNYKIGQNRMIRQVKG